MPEYALIDGDIVAYRAAAASQKDLDWGDGDGPSSYVSADGASETAVQTAYAWTALAGCRVPIICLSSPVNFRMDVWPQYKKNRSNVVRPQALPVVQAALRDRFPSFTLHGLEADDTMGILATSGKYADSVIVTMDKDLATIPAKVFFPHKDQRPHLIREAAATRWWMTQVLTGDTADGYPGCPGIGPKKADVILGEAGISLAAQWAAVVETYESKGLTEDDALVMARLARILRREDYDKQREEILLWHPTRPSKVALRLCGVTPPTPAKAGSSRRAVPHRKPSGTPTS